MTKIMAQAQHLLFKTTETSYSTAVCVRGAGPILGLTAPALRRNVLEPLNATAFAVLEIHSASDSPRDSQRCLSQLGPRAAECKVIHAASWHSNTTRKQTDSFFDSQLFSNRLKTVVGAASVGIAMRAMLSQRLECHALVMQHEARRGQPFRAYASIRSDLFFFQRLPTTLLHRVQRPAIASAVVPSGDDWRANTSVNDNLLFGDVVAFEADASQWQIMRDDDRTMAQPWIPEQIVRLALVRSGVVIAREPVAYCKVSSQGSCRYFGQLSRSLELMGSELLRKYPEAALLLCAGACGPCGNKSAPRLTLQTPEDRARDSNWCQMIDQVRQAGVCQHGWGCQLHRQHRRY